MLSISSIAGTTSFPEWKGERIYMVPFTKNKGLPKDLEHWQPTINSMLENIHCPEQIYLMVDQGIVTPKNSHRRGGMHIDGVWGFTGHKHEWRGCAAGHRTHGDGRHGEQLIVLATDIQASTVYHGDWEGIAKSGGSCDHLNKNTFDVVPIEANKVYVGDTMTLLHESLPTSATFQRTLVRLNITGGKLN
jgi:hypothetical protein